MSVATSRTLTRGVVFIHGAPTALCPHITWAIEAVLGQRVKLTWTPQPAAPRMVRAELPWSGPVGAGAELASSLRGWDHLRYEITEDATAVSDGSRWSYTPRLGIHHTWTSVSGDAVINEDRLRDVMLRTRGDVVALQEEIDLLLGVPWDEELEVFRYAGDGVPVRWLHKVG
jgi:hypothetical protein